MTTPTPPPGFTGRRSRVLASAVDGAHHITLALYAFDDPGHAPVEVPYVELHETHDGARPSRVMALSTLVHLCQNVGEDEVWQIGGREVPGPPAPQLAAQLAEARETIARLNRRCQRAEAIADRFAAGREQSSPGRSLGRALANYAASRLGEVAREAVEGWAASARCEGACRHEECAPPEALRTTLAALTGGGEGATLPRMPTSPTLDAFTAAFYQALVHNPDPEKQPRWEALTPEQQASRREQAKGALLYIGAPYEAGPGSPPPTEPAP